MTGTDKTQTMDAAPAQRPARAPASGARSGALLAVASAASIVANYIFLLAAGRILGSEDYGSLAALLGLLAVVLVPAAALQMGVSREISRRIASGDESGADGFARAALRFAVLGTVPLVAVAFALAVPLGAVLNIESTGFVVLAEITLVTALVFPVAMGVVQGSQRFHALAALYLVPFVFRLGLLAVLAGAGYRLGAAIVASVASAIAGTAMALALIREPLRRGPSLSQRDLRPFLRYLGPVLAGLVGIALLTHVDILVVKARFSGDETGAYAAASAFARVGFFLPATILAVLFPRTAARHARGEETKDILGRSLLATASFCGLLALFYAATGVGLVATTFGADFAEGGEVLAPFALAIGLFSLAHILVGYHLSRGETRYAWIVGLGVAAQVAILAVVPTSLRGVVWANVAIGACLIAAHELVVGSSVPAIRAGLHHVRDQVSRLRAALPEAALVLVGMSAFVCVLFARVVAHLGSTVIGTPGSDSTGSVAWFWRVKQEGYHVLGTTHHSLVSAPFGLDEGNGLNIQWLLPYYPGYLVAKVVGEVAAFNLVVLSGYMLSGVTMYFLARYLGCVPLVAAWAGIIFIIFPWHLARAEHASLLHVEVLALLILSLVAAARRPSWLRFGFVGTAVLACWLTSGYFGAMAVVTTVAFTIAAALTLGRRRGAYLAVGATGAALIATAVVGIGSVVSGVNTGAGLKRVVGDLSIYGLRLDELVVPPSRNIVVGDQLESFHASRSHGSNPTEVVNYLGLLTIALALVWLVIAVRSWSVLGQTRRVATAGLVATFAVGLAFAAPSPILLFGQEIWMPSRLLWEVVPAFRVPSRWDPMLMAAIVPLAALGLQAIWIAVKQSRRRGHALAAAAVGAAMVFSFFELWIKPVPRFRTEPVPPEYVALERVPRGILAEYPLGHSDIYRLWQREHGRPLMNGAPAESPADYARLTLLDPAAPGTAQSLALLGVTAVVIHKGAVVDAEVAPREPAATGAGYRRLGRFDDGDSVWQVVARPAPALVTLPLGPFGKPGRAEDGFVGYRLVSPAGVGLFEIRAKEPGVIRLTFEAEPPEGTRRVLRLADTAGEKEFALDGRSRVSLLVEVPRGSSRLLVKTDPPPTSEENAIVIGVPRAEAASGDPALRSELISANPGF